MGGQVKIQNEETYLPTNEEKGELVDLVAALEKSERGINNQPRLLDSDMKAHNLPPQLADILVRVAHALAEGQAVTVINRRYLLTTQEAADLLNVSRPTLIKILDRNELPHQMAGRHRRIQLADLLEYQQRLSQERAEKLAAMQQHGQEDGIYELDRFSVRDAVG